MEVHQILEELAYDSHTLPREALETAISQRELISPCLIEILIKAATCIYEIIEMDHYQGHLYAMYLLAQFREHKAFLPIIHLMSFPGELPHSIFGDVLTEDLSRILASVCGPQISALYTLIENSCANEYARAAAQSACVWLVGSKQYPRDPIIRYFASLFETLEKTPSFVWDNLVSCLYDLHPQELYPQIKQAYELNLVKTDIIPLEKIESILHTSQEEHLQQLYRRTELIEDTISEMEKWLSCCN